MFPRKFCEIFKKTCFIEHLQRLLLHIAASAVENFSNFNNIILALYAPTPRIFLSFDLKYLLPETFFQKNFLILHHL